jgi:hypothetical protein
MYRDVTYLTGHERNVFPHVISSLPSSLTTPTTGYTVTKCITQNDKRSNNTINDTMLITTTPAYIAQISQTLKHLVLLRR